MNAKLTINDYEITLGHKGLEEIAYWLEDAPENSDLFHELAKSEASAILVNLADKEHLSKLTFRMLIENNSMEVMRAVINSRNARVYMTRRDIENYIDTGDREILTTLANQLTAFTDSNEICEKQWLCNKLVGQPDPSVRYALAENTDTPERFLEDLIDDEDVDVANQARKTLVEIQVAEEEEFDDDGNGNNIPL